MDRCAQFAFAMAARAQKLHDHRLVELGLKVKK